MRSVRRPIAEGLVANSANRTYGVNRRVLNLERAPAKVPPLQVTAPVKKAPAAPAASQARLSVFFCVPSSGLAPASILIDFAGERQSQIVAYYALDDLMNHGYQPVKATVHQALKASGANVNTISKTLGAYDISGDEGIGFLAVVNLPTSTEALSLSDRGAAIQYGENPGARALFAVDDIQILMGQESVPFGSGPTLVDFTWANPTRAALVACELEMDGFDGLTDYSILGGGRDLYDWSNSATMASKLTLSGVSQQGDHPLICVVVVNTGTAKAPKVTDADGNTWFDAATVLF